MASDEATSQGKSKGKGASGVVGIVLATLVAAGAGVGSTFLRPDHSPAPASAPSHADASEKGKHGSETLKSVVDLPPIVTNLAAPRDVWIRIELSLLFGKPAERADQIAAQFGTDVLAYLRTLSADQVEGPAGLLGLRDELNDRAAIRSKGAVTQVAIRALVIQ